MISHFFLAEESWLTENWMVFSWNDSSVHDFPFFPGRRVMADRKDPDCEQSWNMNKIPRNENQQKGFCFEFRGGGDLERDKFNVDKSR